MCIKIKSIDFLIPNNTSSCEQQQQAAKKKRKGMKNRRTTVCILLYLRVLCMNLHVLAGNPYSCSLLSYSINYNILHTKQLCGCRAFGVSLLLLLYFLFVVVFPLLIFFHFFSFFFHLFIWHTYRVCLYTNYRGALCTAT